MPPWFWILGAVGAGGAFVLGRRHGASIADSQGSAYDSDATAMSLLDYGISPTGENAYSGYGGSFVINPSLVSGSGGSSQNFVGPPTPAPSPGAFYPGIGTSTSLHAPAQGGIGPAPQ